MTGKEQRRARMLNRVAGGRLSIAEAAAELGLSVRQVWRLRAAERSEGPAGLVHGNRGRPSPRRTDPSLRARVLALAEGPYRGVNDCQLVELLAEREGISLGRETLRSILRAGDRPSPRRRRAPRHRSRRERMAAEGTLLQLDGSRHDWLEGRGPWLTLLGAVDDASGALVAATFREQEDAAGYLELLGAIVRSHGLPEAIYRDRHSAFEPTQAPRSADPDEPRHRLSQVGRALVELEIASIAAGSPQAKGRIERIWGTLQDRLVVELRLAQVVDRAGANALLSLYLPRFNAQFALGVGTEPAWRPFPDGLDLERILCFKYRRKVGADHTIHLGGRVLQLARARGASGYAGRRVEVHVRLDGSLIAFDGERILAVTPAPADPRQLRARKDDRIPPGSVPETASVPWTPPAGHPWRRVRSDTALGRLRLTESLGR